MVDVTSVTSSAEPATGNESPLNGAAISRYDVIGEPPELSTVDWIQRAVLLPPLTPVGACAMRQCDHKRICTHLDEKAEVVDDAVSGLGSVRPVVLGVSGMRLLRVGDRAPSSKIGHCAGRALGDLAIEFLDRQTGSQDVEERRGCVEASAKYAVLCRSAIGGRLPAWSGLHRCRTPTDSVRLPD